MWALVIIVVIITTITIIMVITTQVYDQCRCQYLFPFPDFAKVIIIKIIASAEHQEIINRTEDQIIVHPAEILADR